MSKHTKGPWGVDLPYGEPGTYVQAADTSLVCRVFDRDKEQHFANALLIAAAPDLLETLTGVQDYLDAIDEMQPDRNHGTEGERIRRAVAAAIAKATGLALLLLTLTGCATTSTVVVRHDLPGGSVDYVATIQH